MTVFMAMSELAGYFIGVLCYLYFFVNTSNAAWQATAENMECASWLVVVRPTKGNLAKNVFFLLKYKNGDMSIIKVPCGEVPVMKVLSWGASWNWEIN